MKKAPKGIGKNNGSFGKKASGFCAGPTAPMKGGKKQVDVSPSLDKRDSAKLDNPPPSPSFKRAKTMLDPDQDEGSGIGAMASTPQAKALMGLKMVQQGTQQIALVVPGLAQQLGDFLGQLQMVTVQAVANMSQGGPSAVPGMGPMSAPPPPMPQMPPGAAAPAPTPNVPGMQGFSLPPASGSGMQ